MLLSASTYAGTPDHVMRIVPLSPYKFCWSPKVSDLLFAEKTLADSDEGQINSYLDSVGYCETGLQEAHDKGHEVMLFCERYAAIPVGMLGEKATSPTVPFILTK